jgi:hypothetical protein
VLCPTISKPSRTTPRIIAAADGSRLAIYGNLELAGSSELVADPVTHLRACQISELVSQFKGIPFLGDVCGLGHCTALGDEARLGSLNIAVVKRLLLLVKLIFQFTIAQYGTKSGPRILLVSQ